MERILVPLDGSELAEAILPQVRRIVSRHPAEILLVRALSLLELAKREAAERYIRKLTFQFVNQGFRAQGFVREGPAAETILSTASETGASLIALTSHGRSGMSRLLHGSVAESLLRHSPVPVLLLSRSTATAALGVESRGHLEARPFRNLLLPLDGSPASLDILPALKEFARPIDATVVLLHVEAPDGLQEKWPVYPESFAVAEESIQEACIPTRRLHAKGAVAEEIVKAGVRESIDLIALSTHGREGPPRWVFGSVAEEVARTSPVPLLVVRRQAQAVRAGG